MDKVIEETKCEFYDNYECNAYYDIYPEPEDCQRDLCRTHEDCYYRQLKRLGQENAELKEEFKNYKTSKENSYQNLQKEWQQLQWDIRKLTTENEQLKKSIDRIMQNKEIKTIDLDVAFENQKLKEENKRLKARLRPLEDSYFKGLSSIQITELAKKSIRITAENRKLEYALQDIREYCENQNLKADYTACEVIRRIDSVIGAEE